MQKVHGAHCHNRVLLSPFLCVGPFVKSQKSSPPGKGLKAFIQAGAARADTGGGVAACGAAEAGGPGWHRRGRKRTNLLPASYILRSDQRRGTSCVAETLCTLHCSSAEVEPLMALRRHFLLVGAAGVGKQALGAALVQAPTEYAKVMSVWGC